MQLLALTPQNDAQRWLQAAALRITSDIASARWSLFEQIEVATPECRRVMARRNFCIAFTSVHWV